MRMVLVCATFLLSNGAFAQCDSMVEPVDASVYTATETDYVNGFSTLYRGPYARTQPFYEGVGSHPGVDITHDVAGSRLTKASPVVAICDGEIIRVTQDGLTDGGWGNSIVLRHTVPGVGTVYSAYAHLDRLAQTFRVTSPPTIVTRNKLLGYVGTTGASTGVHLHFQIDTALPDPHPFFPNRFPSTTADGMKEVNTPDPDFYVANRTLSPLALVARFPPPSASSTIGAVRYLTFTDGDPGIPGDGRTITSSAVIVPWFQPTIPLSLSGVANGFTVTAFALPGRPIVVINLMFGSASLDPLTTAAGGNCTVQVGKFASPITVNGVTGQALFVSQTDVDHVVSVLNGNANCSGTVVAPGDVRLYMMLFDATGLGHGQSMVDAVAIGAGPGAIPTTSTIPLVVDTGPGPSALPYSFAAVAGPNSPNGGGSLGGVFTLNQSLTIGSVKGWMLTPPNNVPPGSTLHASIYSNIGFSPGQRIFTSAFNLGAAGLPSWQGPTGLSWSLGAGTYWVVFEGTGNDTGAGIMPLSVPSPLSAYKSFTSVTGVWITPPVWSAPHPLLGFGVQISAR